MRLLVLLDELEAGVENVLVDRRHFERLRIHKIIQVAVVIGIVHLSALDVSGGILVVRVERRLGNAAGDDIAHLDADKGCTLAGLDVLELDDLHHLAVHVKRNAVPEITD